MIEDARGADLPGSIDADIAIIGSGAAGIALALTLADTRLRIIVLEAGGETFDKAQQDFYRAQEIAPDSHGPVDMFRRRVLGGSTSVWGGRCIPFDPIDFEERPWMPYARWPITYGEVARFYPAALEMAQAGAPEFTAEEAWPDDLADLAPGVSSSDVILDRIERFSHPTHFGTWYRKRIAEMTHVRLLHHAPVEQILVRNDGARVAGARIRVADHRIEVRAPRVVVAAGGLESARLLLASNEVRSAGLGNDRDLVGRFYQCHLEGEIGTLHFHDPARSRLDYQRSHDGIYCRRYIWLSPEAQRRHALAGLILRPAHANIVDPSHRNPILSAMFLAKSFIVPEYARKMTSLEQAERKARGGSEMAFHARHLCNVVAGTPRLAAFAADWTRRRILARRKLPSVVLLDHHGVYPADVNAEQEPHPDSRVQLGDERDALGMPRLRIDWRTTEADHRRLAGGMRILARAFEPSAGVSLELGDDLDEQVLRRVPVGGHHIGTCRMATSAADGVCNPYGELFDCPGLYMAGAATFPTSGFANPTLTLLALSIRLGERLAAA